MNRSVPGSVRFTIVSLESARVHIAHVVPSRLRLCASCAKVPRAPLPLSPHSTLIDYPRVAVHILRQGRVHLKPLQKPVRFARTSKAEIERPTGDQYNPPQSTYRKRADLSARCAASCRLHAGRTLACSSRARTATGSRAWAGLAEPPTT